MAYRYNKQDRPPSRAKKILAIVLFRSVDPVWQGGFVLVAVWSFVGGKRLLNNWKLQSWVWWVIVGGAVCLVGFIVATSWLWSRYRLRRVRTWNGVCRMDPFLFEQLVADMLKFRGWKNVRVTPKKRDGGIDVMGVWDDVRYIVQCKRYNGKNYVTVSDVRELFGVARSMGDDVCCLFVTTGRYSRDARAFGRANKMELWDAPITKKHVLMYMNNT